MISKFIIFLNMTIVYYYYYHYHYYGYDFIASRHELTTMLELVELAVDIQFFFGIVTQWIARGLTLHDIVGGGVIVVRRKLRIV